MSHTPPTSAQGASVLGSIGGLIEGTGSLFQARQEEQLGDRNATVYEQQAQATRTSQELLEVQKRRIIASRTGSQVSAIAGSGLKMSGSPIAVMMDSLTNANLDIAIDRYNSEIKARGFESDAAMSRFEGKQRASRERFKAGRSFLGTAADIYKTQREIGGGGDN